MKSNRRYLPPEKFLNAYRQLNGAPPLECIGYSVEGLPIFAATIGRGPQKILAWSQMHGNETTSTRALLRLIPYLLSRHTNGMKHCCLRIIFQLNPDGAKRYTRQNANGVDLNRDAQAQTQPETKALLQELHLFQPNYCLNLHGQRTIYSAGDPSTPASLSFLAPSADKTRSLTPARKVAMRLITSIANAHEQTTQWAIGRYDDAFNLNCTGDYFTAQGIPTLLFEAGHFPEDYHRDETVLLFLKSLQTTIESIANQHFNTISPALYFRIPENQKTLCDLIFQNVTTVNKKNITKSSFFVQFEEQLQGEAIHFIPKLIDMPLNTNGLKTIDLREKTQENPIIVHEFSSNILKELLNLSNS